MINLMNQRDINNRIILSNLYIFASLLFNYFQLEIFNMVSVAVRNSTRAGGNVSSCTLESLLLIILCIYLFLFVLDLDPISFHICIWI